MRYWVFAIFATFSGMLRAYDVEVDGIYYGLIGTRSAYVTYPGEWALGDGNGLESYSGDIVIPAQITCNGHTYTVKSIGENAFAGCDELTSVQLPSTVRAISGCAFLGCTGLRQVSLPANLQAVACCAFVGCTSLQEITLPRHAEIVDSLSFYCCASLKSLALPYCVRTICQGALEHLPALTDLYCFSYTPPTAEQGAFTLADQRRCTLHVPAKALEVYKKSPLWSDFYEIVVLSDEDYVQHGYQRGDLNNDGCLDAEDLALLQRLIVSLPADSALRWAADVNGDGSVNAIDYVTLAKRINP